jgi:glycosyltransferase involved in cell wall biosynthesis
MEVPLWLGQEHPYCVVIPVINEGERIKRLLKRLTDLQISAIADIIIVDGGSTDGSLEIDALKQMDVRGLIVKAGPGRLSAQLRCAYAFALDQGYHGIITIDGNDKDDPEAIPRFIDALNDGIDFVQASRFISGGVAENTPKSRDFAIRYIHAPALSLSSGFSWTDTTQGFRGYSRKMLLDPAVNPFRDIFRDYELLAYLSHRVPRLRYRCKEIATVRRYPMGEVPTKISAFRGNLKVLKTLFLACFGAYNARENGIAKLAPINPIYWMTFFGLLVSILAFFPGWMSNDSIIQYRESRAGQFNDWHPVLMGWWWRQLDHLYQGPALFLFQNLLLYWGGWGLLANAIRREAGRSAYLVPLLGLWPALFFLLGQIWKDVAFACCQFMAWAIIVNAFCWQRKTSWFERCAIIVLLSFGIGVKTNGIVAVPFLVAFWLYTDKVQFGSRFVALVMSITSFAALIPYGITQDLPIKHDNPIQYTQVYDLLAISVKTGRNLLPKYINQRAQLSQSELERIYVVGHNNGLFYGVTKNLVGLRAPTPNDASELRSSWLKAIEEYPGDYIAHRWNNFLSLLRIGEPAAAYIASPVVVENEFGIEFSANKISGWLSKQPSAHPWLFFPWLYFLLTLASIIVMWARKKYRFLSALIGASSFAFIAPHFFIAPASDFRYLYYSYFCSAIVFSLAVFGFRSSNHYKEH